MRKTISRIIAVLMLIFAVSVIAAPSTVYAAGSVAVDQKQASKKMNKFLKKCFKSDEVISYKLKSKKTGKRYTFTITATLNQLSANDVVVGSALNGDPGYKKLIETVVKVDKIQYKNAKKFGLKKPTVRYILKTNDGFTVVTVKNGKIEE